MTLHYGKLKGTRRTFILAAKISTFMEDSGLFDQVERDLDILKHVFENFFTPNERLMEPVTLEKDSREHACSVSLVFHCAFALLYTLLLRHKRE